MLSLDKQQLVDIDWDFSNVANEGIHTLHWYPATFVSAIPGSLIPLLSTPNACLLDPFCGIGTSGVEAIRLGRRFIGFDSNPVATLVTKAKLLFPDISRLEQQLARAIKDRGGLLTLTGSRNFRHPNEVVLRQWYHQQTYGELLFLIELIQSLGSGNSQIAAQAVFSSILKTVSSQGKHWGWVCDNVKPRRDEIQYKNALETFQASLSQFSRGIRHTLEDMRTRNVDCKRETIRSKWTICCCDALEGMERLPADSIDLIVTSPPYLGVADYVKSQRLSFLWFHRDVLPIEGFSSEDFEALRTREIGCRSFRHRSTSFDEYVHYIRAFIGAAKRVLKKGSALCLVFGESKARRNTAEEIQKAASEVGFRVGFSAARNIRLNRRRLMAKVGGEQVRIYIAA